MLVVDCRDFGRLPALETDTEVVDRGLGSFEAISNAGSSQIQA